MDKTTKKIGVKTCEALTGLYICSPVKSSSGYRHPELELSPDDTNFYLFDIETHEKVTLEAPMLIHKAEIYEEYPGYTINDKYFMGIGMTSIILNQCDYTGH